METTRGRFLYFIAVYDKEARTLVVNTVIMPVFSIVLQMESCMPVQSVISKEMNPSFIRVSAKEPL